jgi:uncharacterized membrane protein
MGVLECSLANSIVPSSVLPLALLVIPEYKSWNSLSDKKPTACFVIALLCCSVTLCKHADRLCKFSIVSEASTMFFAAVDANMKVVAGIGSFLFFDEKVYWPQVVGFILIFFALIVMYYDKKMKQSIVAARVSFRQSVRKSIDNRADDDAQLKLQRAISVASSFGISAQFDENRLISVTDDVDEDAEDIREVYEMRYSFASM